MRKNGKVELVRFIFSCIIIIFHCHRTFDFSYITVGGRNFAVLNRGYFGVEFFLLITGFLTARSIHGKLCRIKAGTDAPVDLGRQSFHYFLRKYMSVFPYHVITFSVLIVIRLFTREIWGDPVDVIVFFFDSIPEFFFLQKFGFTYTNVDVIEWYISAMLIALLLLYPIAFRFYSMFTHVIAPLGSLWILGVLQYNFDTVSDQDRWLGFGYACVFRAIAEMALGMSLFEAARFTGRYEHSKSTSLIFTLFEAVGFVLAIGYSLSSYTSHYETHVLIFLAVSIMLTFTGQTYGNALFAKKWILWLGKMSLPLYLSQLVGIAIVNKYFAMLPFAEACVLVFAITSVMALVCSYGGSRLQVRMLNKLKLPVDEI